MKKVSDVVAGLDRTVATQTLTVTTVQIRVLIRCDEPMAAMLRHYFAEALADDSPTDDPVDATVEILQGQTLAEDPDWVEWVREQGKTNRKDAYHDLENGRLIRKVRTGMTFLQSPEAQLAFGPCMENPSQVVNFVNTQILNTCKRAGWEICHAAALTKGDRGLAIAGLSGGGKSTSVLRLMDLNGTRFVTNDRLMVRRTADGAKALGIPKQPRINPGTILNNPRLVPMLSDDRRQALASMQKDALWELEEKHDLFIGEVYGEGRVHYTMPLTEFWVLNWTRNSHEPTRLLDADLTQRPDLLGAIMKSAGPFYQPPNGVFPKGQEPLDANAYLAQLGDVRVREVVGGIDFDAIYRAGQGVFA
ncbi:HprK-related kinase B [Falsiphaeobacter marinintestinus]|uniref:HprK-related kinase B n=1 Tax=Falsiphaeobacter marinintestinus TaxID=1492905 RepID=UPI0016481A5C|nr:HprK-related kinase B [Phaeobacter marinintestinus]